MSPARWLVRVIERRRIPRQKRYNAAHHRPFVSAAVTTKEKR